MNKKVFAIGCLSIVVLFVVCVGAWMTSSYNGFVQSQEEAKTAFSNIDVILKRNQQNLNSLEQILRKVTTFNQETLENMVAARAKATQLTIDPSNCTPQQMEEWNKAQGALTQALSRLMVVHEADYPELKGNEQFEKVMVELEGAVNRLSEARRKYNQAVQSYNISIRTFPKNMIAGMFGFTPMYLYEAPTGTEENTTDFSGLNK
ncbi:MAG: LemA family protein [Prevotella sp.]|jgi:LemA protein|nr:LemA family protein [Prevotella sp.]